LIQIWLRRSSSATRRSCLILPRYTSNRSCLSAAAGYMMLTRFCTASARENSVGFRRSFPLSTLDRSRMSLIKVRRWSLARLILVRQSSTCAGLSTLRLAMAVMPTIAFIGVRISWDMEERNSVLALLALSAAVRDAASFRLRKRKYTTFRNNRARNPKQITAISDQCMLAPPRSFSGIEPTNSQFPPSRCV